ncbi:hypothetical protein RhiXN_12141 [Rhizoctonia solani]|uniref:Uncharacterized protein n=1 Tax=Rhizoctonia solani TaxID=456999 RepID=A0A8H8P793_9AGAM|nr:uncharacterized protein RhiXN_12141 [Rhizoctonia solani]QRW26480.1 hypothetical protein RhiXN_12141 [Rhizoctonia solani]
MSSSAKPSIKFALLAYSVYCWVDGSARTRNNPSSDFSIDPLREPELTPVNETRGWKAVWEWMLRSRGSSMSEEEQSALGRMDAITAFLLFNVIQRFSFHPGSIQTPFLFPLSISTLKDAGKLRWKILVVTAALLSLVHETQRAALIYFLRRRRENLTNQIRKDLANMRIGQVAVRGDSITLERQEDEDEEECLICSGSAETMSTSSHADTNTTRTGPLEAFCTIAPQKHLAHRQFSLKEDCPDSQSPLEQLFIRAGIILQASGFDYIAAKLKRPVGSSSNTDGDSFTIHPSTSPVLATLYTSTPPCPGCRSHHTSADPTGYAERPRVVIPFTFVHRVIGSRFWRAWIRIVTGRTISAYFGSLLSFMTVLAAITKVRENPTLTINL